MNLVKPVGLMGLRIEETTARMGEEEEEEEEDEEVEGGEGVRIWTVAS